MIIWPRAPKANLAYRLKIREKADGNPSFQRQVVSLARQDILFFVNTFCWLFEPRPRPGQKNIIPFCSYEYQDRIFMEILKYLGKEDLGIEKSRDLGLTWIMLTSFFHQWWAAPKDRPVSFGLMSRNMDLVDKSGKTDTLFWKLDFLYWRLPKWMRPKIERTHGQLTNMDNLSTIEGSPTTGDAFRGGRKTAIGMDEFHSFKPGEDYSALAATQHATDSRLFVSTPKGPSGAYYDVMHDKKSSMVKLVCDWKDHPDRKRGLYTTINGDIGGELKILDEEYKFPSKYPFVLDGKTRSPYYDRECKRPGATPQSIAQELDRDYGGAAAVFFPTVMIRKHKVDYCREPTHRGMLIYDPETLEPEFVPNANGPLLLWCELDYERRPNPDRDYGLGCDVAAGTAGDFSSNSSGVVIDATTRETVALYMSNSVRPGSFADMMMALGYFFTGAGRVPAKLNWEANGIGQIFSDQVKIRQYPNVWYREVQQINSTKKTQKPGWWSNAETKNIALGRMAQDMGRDPAKFIIRSDTIIEETGQYIFVNGKVEHSKSLTTQDESAKGQSHGDTVIAAALGYMTIPDIRVVQRYRESTAEPPMGSMAWRLKQYDRSILGDRDDWDDEDFELSRELDELYQF